MEYLSRLVGGASPSPTRQAGYNASQQRLMRFKKAHDHLQQACRRNSSAKQSVPAEYILSNLESIRKTLQDEIQTPVPHLCLRHVSTFQLYIFLVQITSTYCHESIFTEVLDIFRILVDSEEVDFLGQKGFADASISLIGKISATGPLIVSFPTEESIVEFLFGLASRIRLQSELLATWFKPSRSLAQVESSSIEERRNAYQIRAEKDAFPLFYLTLNYVHHDGRVGDFARTGLLYLIESAANSEALEKWIVEGDLATLMASGLGALYSRLSRKLVLSFREDAVPTVIAVTKVKPSHIPRDAVETDSPELQAPLDTFLSYLVFWQDVLEHCKSHDIKQSLLDHFRLLFLQQLLYPSLIESSDADGGSSVAVLTYLRCIIESINNVDLLHITLQYLLVLPEKHDEETAPVRPTTLARRRKSSILITNLSMGQEKPKPDLFTLVDLVLTGLHSPNQQTITATLQLLSVIVHNQHQYAAGSIIKTKPLGSILPRRTIDSHIRDTEALFSMAEDLIENTSMREFYEAHLQDARVLLESHCCFTQNFPIPRMVDIHLDEITEKPYYSRMQPHCLRIDDPLLESLVLTLSDFLANDISTNLSLTQTLSALASCRNTCLENWLLGDSDATSTHTLASDDAGDHDNTMTLPKINGGSPMLSAATASHETDVDAGNSKEMIGTSSPVFATLDSLVQQVERYRHDIQEFDTYLAERRHIFDMDENIQKTTNTASASNRTSEEQTSRESDRVVTFQSRTGGQIGSISERLLSEASSANISRSSSPRGRQPTDLSASTSTFVDRLNHLRISPSPSPSKPAQRTFSPSPLRKSSLTATPPRLITPAINPTDALLQKVKIRTRSHHDRLDARDIIGSETSSIRSESFAAEAKHSEVAFREITLSHLVTNVIVLQEFIMELAAILEVRAGLFDEIAFV